MMVVPSIMAAAAAAGTSSAQAADNDMTANLDDTCLECAGIGIVPCESSCGPAPLESTP